MRKAVLGVSKRTLRALKVILIPGMALLLALLPAAVFEVAMPTPVCAAIQLRGSVTAGTTTDTNLTIDKPAEVVAGDVMIVNIAKVGNDWTQPYLEGWTTIAGSDLGGTSTRYGAVLYRVVDGTEGNSFTFALGAGTSSAVGFIVAFSGVDTSGGTPFDVTPGDISVQGNQVAVAADNITTASANAAVIMFGMVAGQGPTWDSWTTTSLGPLVELYDSQADLNTASVGAAWAIKADAGDTGTGVAMLSFAERNGGILIALKPTQPTTLTVTTTAGTYGGRVSLTATLSPAVPGRTIDFYINGEYKDSADTDSNGVATLAGVALTVDNARLDAGTYTGTYNTSGVGASFAGDAGYDPSSDAANLTVHKRDIEVTADDMSKVYGDDDPEFTYKITSGSPAGNDAFSGTLVREAGEDLGSYAIRQGTLDLGGNYNLTFIEGTFTISAEETDDPEDTSSAPTVTGINPQSGQPGDTLEVIISGSNLLGATAVDFGPGVTVNNFDVESSTRIVANITIDPSAGAVENKIVITTPYGEAQLPGAFSIILSEEVDEASSGTGLWSKLILLLLLLLVAITVGFLVFAWFKRRRKAMEPESAPVLAPSRPPGGIPEAQEFPQILAAEQPLGETALEAGLEQGLMAAATKQPPEAMPEAVEPQQAPPVMAAEKPIKEEEEVTGLPLAPVVATPKPRRRTPKRATASLNQLPDAAKQPPRRKPRKVPASASSRPRTPAKKRKKSTG